MTEDVGLLVQREKYRTRWSDGKLRGTELKMQLMKRNM